MGRLTVVGTLLLEYGLSLVHFFVCHDGKAINIAALISARRDFGSKVHRSFGV